MVEMMRAFRFDRRRALRALSLGLRSPLFASWRVAHHFYVLAV